MTFTRDLPLDSGTFKIGTDQELLSQQRLRISTASLVSQIWYSFQFSRLPLSIRLHIGFFYSIFPRSGWGSILPMVRLSTLATSGLFQNPFLGPETLRLQRGLPWEGITGHTPDFSWASRVSPGWMVHDQGYRKLASLINKIIRCNAQKVLFPTGSAYL